MSAEKVNGLAECVQDFYLLVLPTFSTSLPLQWKGMKKKLLETKGGPGNTEDNVLGCVLFVKLREAGGGGGGRWVGGGGGSRR